MFEIYNICLKLSLYWHHPFAQQRLQQNIKKKKNKKQIRLVGKINAFKFFCDKNYSLKRSLKRTYTRLNKKTVHGSGIRLNACEHYGKNNKKKKKTLTLLRNGMETGKYIITVRKRIVLRYNLLYYIYIYIK